MRIIFSLLLFLLPAVSAAQHKWDLHYLTTIKQSTHETPDQFLVRVGMYLRDYTAQSGFEACGSICTSDTGQSIMLFTGKSQVMCPISFGCEGEQYTLSPKTIHSHPANWRVVLNDLDAQLLNERRRVFKKKPGRAMSFSPNRFSPDDYDLGPGYMVNGDRLWFQEGKGTERILFLLPPSKPQP